MKSKYSTKSIHDGEMLRSYIDESPMNLTAVARHMGIAHSTLLSFYKRTSLRTSVLWQAAQVLERNFFFDIGMQLPAGMPSTYNTELTQRIAELESENERLRIENETYQKIIRR